MRYSTAKPSTIIMLGVISAGIGLALDLLRFPEIGGEILFLILPLIGLWSPRRGYIYLLALLATTAVTLGYFLPVLFHGAPASLPVNRILCLLTIWVISGVVIHVWGNKALLRTIFDTAAEGIIMIDAHGIVESFNKMAETIFGYPAKDVVGKNVALLMPAPHNEKHNEYINRYLATGEAQVIGQYREVEGKRKDGTTFPMLLGVAEVVMGNRRVFTGIVRDITQRKENEAAVLAANAELEQRSKDLAQANEDLSQFAHVVSHDLKAPLRAIHNYADWLYQDLADRLEGDHKEYLEGLQQAVQQAEALIEDLLELSRIGRKEMPMEKVPLSRFFGQLVSVLNLGPDLVVEIQPDLPMVTSSPVLLNQIFQNLILNGVKYNQSAPKLIRIFGTQANGQYEIGISDNGIGINKNYHETIFQIFQRLHTREEYEGTGIGLAIVKKAAHHLGYTVRVESRVGQGSTFFIGFPVTRLKTENLYDSNKNTFDPAGRG